METTTKGQVIRFGCPSFPFDTSSRFPHLMATFSGDLVLLFRSRCSTAPIITVSQACSDDLIPCSSLGCKNSIHTPFRPRLVSLDCLTVNCLLCVGVSYIMRPKKVSYTINQKLVLSYFCPCFSRLNTASSLNSRVGYYIKNYL